MKKLIGIGLAALSITGCSTLESAKDGYFSLVNYDIQKCEGQNSESQKKACLAQKSEAIQKYKSSSKSDCAEIKVDLDRKKCLFVVEAEGQSQIAADSSSYKTFVNKLEQEANVLPKDFSESTVIATKSILSRANQLIAKKVDFDSTNDDRLRLSEIIEKLNLKLSQVEANTETQKFYNMQNAANDKDKAKLENYRKTYPTEYKKCLVAQPKVKELFQKFQAKSVELREAASDRRKKELNAEVDSIAYQMDKIKADLSTSNCPRFFN